MFEFAISQQRPHPPTRRFYAAMMLSCLSHFVAVLILIEYPQLLGPGLKAWLRRPIFFTASTPRQPVWRTVAVLGKEGGMRMPSADTLKKNTYDWAAHREGAPAPPIRLKWDGVIADGGKPKDKPAPDIKPVMGTQEPKTPAETKADSGPPEVPAVAALPSSGSDANKGVTAYLPQPQPNVEPRQIPKKPAETAAMVSPSAIPGTDKPSAGAGPANISRSTSAPQPKAPTAQVFEDEQKAIRSEGTGFFDTRGFPLGDYASTIIERIKGNWYIPSNLRSSQGRTTVIFFIDKDGRFTDARIVASSGSNSLDLAALNAIIGSNPFPPLPKGFPGDHVGAKFVFSYNERQ